MKNLILTLPFLFLLFTPDNLGLFNYAPVGNDNPIEASVVEADCSTDTEAVTLNGSITSTQVYSECNTCASCDDDCINSEAACATFIVTLNVLKKKKCLFNSNQMGLNFGSNSRYICSITKISPNSWRVRFNVIEYSCSKSDTPFQFNIPVTGWYSCQFQSFVVNGSIPMLIC